MGRRRFTMNTEERRRRNEARCVDGFEPAIEILGYEIGKCTEQIEALRGLEAGNESLIAGLENRRKSHEDQLNRLFDEEGRATAPHLGLSDEMAYD
jgi:hypothetical protein